MLKSKLILFFLVVCFLNIELYSNASINNCKTGKQQQSESVLKDNKGRLIGKIKTKPDGTQELRDRSGHYLGKFNPKTNSTYDSSGHRIGMGNLLSSLLNYQK